MAGGTSLGPLQPPSNCPAATAGAQRGDRQNPASHRDKTPRLGTGVNYAHP